MVVSGATSTVCFVVPEPQKTVIIRTKVTFYNEKGSVGVFGVWVSVVRWMLGNLHKTNNVDSLWCSARHQSLSANSVSDVAKQNVPWQIRRHSFTTHSPTTCFNTFFIFSSPSVVWENKSRTGDVYETHHITSVTRVLWCLLSGCEDHHHHHYSTLAARIPLCKEICIMKETLC